MRIAEYLTEAEAAIRHVLGEIHRESEEIGRLRADLDRLTRETEDGYRRAEFLAMNPELDDEGVGTALHWDTYFGPDKDRYHADRQLRQAIEQRLAVHDLSRSMLAGSILQYAKQGISIRFGREREGITAGRQVAGMSIDEVIWQSRNQALHWEDGDFSRAVIRCFESLGKGDAAFRKYRERSMAFDVLQLLGWSTFEDLRRDLLSLDPG